MSDLSNENKAFLGKTYARSVRDGHMPGLGNDPKPGPEDVKRGKEQQRQEAEAADSYARVNPSPHMGLNAGNRAASGLYVNSDMPAPPEE